MSILVAGPTGSGKSTLIHSAEIAAFLPSGTLPMSTVYGYQLIDKDIPEDVVVHYNLLHPILSGGRKDLEEAGIHCNFIDDAIFRKIMADHRISFVIVLVAPVAELLERAKNRKYVEETDENLLVYDSALWLNIIETTNLSAVYERFFRHLEQRGLPYVVVCSSAYAPVRFNRSDRVFVPANLRGEFPALPSKSEIAAILEMPGCHYQSALLPHGIVTDKGGYPHIIQGRHESLDAILNDSLWNSSVLDIGCALGDLLYRAERLGASRMVGVEPHMARFETAEAIAHLLHSRAELNCCDFMDLQEEGSFDHVFMLNVLHHVKDFHSFLEKSCRLAGKSLTIEFPTLKDAKFAEANGYPLPGILDKLPLIGVSSSSVDQTYVFSPKAIERICCEEIGGFNRVSQFNSPLKHRRIMVFER